MPTSREKISLVINTINEEENIAACITSAKKTSDQIIVADMHSTDKTRDIAKSMGAEVYLVDNYGYVEPARNFAVAQAKHDWILLLDADERLNDALGAKLRKIANKGKYQVVRIPYKNIIFGKWIKHTWWWPDYHERFYKKGFVSWSNAIHTAPSITGNVLTLPARSENAIYHENYSHISQFIEKMNRYTEYSVGLDEKITDAPNLIQYSRGEFLFRYIHQNGYKDGLHGYFLSKLMEFYRLVEIAKYWEKKGFKDIVSPKELHSAISSNIESTAVSELQQQVNALEQELARIKSAKFFRVWQSYCSLRDKIFAK